ncbi:MAG TPA: endolytic transglycosylase MltG [Acidisarcina sp.]
MRRLLALLVLCAAAAGVYVWLAPAGPRTQTLVEIPAGTSTRQIAVLLKGQHLIRSRYAFEVMRLVRGGTLKAGEYRFDHPARLSQVYGRLVRGDVYTLSVTIPEGANIFDIAQRLQVAHLVTQAAFLKAAGSQTALVRDLDPGASTLEGYLFPDTYHFAPSIKPEQVAAAMVRRFRLAAAESGLPSAGVRRTVTLASLVERETPIPAERAMVASVFLNRLKRGIPLMTDPSVIYAALLDGRYRGTIYQSDLASESPYNTYKHAGLPPGPICNPGLASLRAAIAPAQTNYLYFVAATADPSGHSRFATTLEEHSRNVQVYRHSVAGVRLPASTGARPSGDQDPR